MDMEAMEKYFDKNGGFEMPDFQQKFSLSYAQAKKILSDFEAKGRVRYSGNLRYSVIRWVVLKTKEEMEKEKKDGKKAERKDGKKAERKDGKKEERKDGKKEEKKDAKKGWYRIKPLINLDDILYSEKKPDEKAGGEATSDKPTIGPNLRKKLYPDETAKEEGLLSITEILDKFRNGIKHNPDDEGEAVNKSQMLSCMECGLEDDYDGYKCILGPDGKVFFDFRIKRYKSAYVLSDCRQSVALLKMRAGEEVDVPKQLGTVLALHAPVYLDGEDLKIEAKTRDEVFSALLLLYSAVVTVKTYADVMF